MSKLTEKPLANLISKYLQTLVPLAKDVTLKTETKKVTQPDGSVKTVTKELKGDAFFDENTSKAIADSVAKGISEHVGAYLHETVIAKLNELIDGYNALPGATPVEKITL